MQGIPSKFDHKKILKVIKKEFACNGTVISDTDSKGLGEVIQLQGDHRLKIKDFLVDSQSGLGLDEKNIKVCTLGPLLAADGHKTNSPSTDSRLLSRPCLPCRSSARAPRRSTPPAPCRGRGIRGVKLIYT